MNIAVIGATGLVGREILKVFDELQISINNLIPVASDKSFGKIINFRNTEFRVTDIENAISQKPDIAIYSAGSAISLATAERFANAGTFVIDNSSAWRMDSNVPLVVPEVNIHLVNKKTRIIANPNCSTIQLVVALNPLRLNYGIHRIVVSTYQSVTGTGASALEQLMAEREGRPCASVYPHPIDMNCFPQGGSFIENDYTTEEMKLIHETHKIFNDYSISIAPTVVRIPVIGGHSESVYVELKKEVQIDEIKNLLSSSKGIIVLDKPNENVYPMPLTVKGKNETFVGRIRKDLFAKNAIQMWIVADNLRKGAATNAVQIAQYIQSSLF